MRRTNRRLALLKRSGLFGSDTHGARIARACTKEDLHQAYGLVHDIFVSTGYITPRISRVRIRPFEALVETATFIARTREAVVGVQSIVLDSPDLGLPSDLSFKAELDALRAEGISLAEATNEAVCPEFRKSAVATELMRSAAAQSFAERRDVTVTAVSPSHAGFYGLLGFEQLSDVRSYSREIDDPVVLMGLKMNPLKLMPAGLDESQAFVRDYLWFSNPYVEKVVAWQNVARRYFEDPDFLRDLFVAESDLLEACTESQYEAIRRNWGNELFARATDTTPIEREQWTSRYVPARPVTRPATNHARRPA